MTPGRNAHESCRKTSRDEVLGAVARKALPKNLIRLLPVQDHKTCSPKTALPQGEQLDFGGPFT
jgi:hypothetical protein